MLLEIHSKVSLFLPDNWIAVADGNGVNIMLLSRKEEKAIQRRFRYSANGDLSLSVHGKPYDIAAFLDGKHQPGSLTADKINSIVDFIVTITNEIRALEICSGADYLEYKEAWNDFPDSYVDHNFFQECRYVNTLRVNKCQLLVEPRRWRCTECNKAGDRLRKKIISVLKEEPNPYTADVFLTTGEKLSKIKKLNKKVEAGKKRIDRLQEKMAACIKAYGVTVDNELGELMVNALQSQNLSPNQSLFLQQQLKASQCKSAVGMRWHPEMIKLSLAIFMASPAAYNIILDSGMMKFPASRTLFDYSHVYEAEEGISMPVLKSVHERLKKMPDEKKFKWHVIMCDEMHISKNIVYHKRTGTFVGYVKISDVDQAVNELKAYLDNIEEEQPEIATKVLSFMIKGICNSIKEVVASYSMNKLVKEKLFKLTWNVITECERSGVQVICMTSDGNSVNRAFFKMNTPIHPTESGIVYDTWNNAAPDRPLYFMSDVPHLVKTIRNNFFNSRPYKNAKRCLTLHGEKILWNTIIDLFNAKKDKTLRKSYKLNHANVYPDSYSCMSVINAFEVMSDTVASDIEAQGWPNTAITVDFIRRVNYLADCLNGAYSFEGKRKAKPALDPYRDPGDKRFDDMLGFLEYLEKWKEEAEQLDATLNQSTLQNAPNPDESFHSLHDVHEDVETNEDLPPARKRQLCQQTLEGIEISIRGFMGAVKYLLTEGGVHYVNARVFCQDPLEQYFSKQRAKGGGSNTPNLMKYFENARAIHIQRGLNIRKRKGNSREEEARGNICHEKMPKRKSSYHI